MDTQNQHQQVTIHHPQISSTGASTDGRFGWAYFGPWVVFNFHTLDEIDAVVNGLHRLRDQLQAVQRPPCEAHDCSKPADVNNPDGGLWCAGHALLLMKAERGAA